LLPQMNLILKNVLKKREEIDQFGIDRRVSSWTIMLKEIAGNARKEKEARDLLAAEIQRDYLFIKKSVLLR